LDGIPIQELLKDPRKYQERTLFWHYPLEKPHFLGGRSSGAVRQGNFKLIEFYDDGTIELYNLKEDLGETTNLSGKLPAQRDRLLGLLRDWRKSLPR
jgi:arylsulfatase A-like enzyme